MCKTACVLRDCFMPFLWRPKFAIGTGGVRCRNELAGRVELNIRTDHAGLLEVFLLVTIEAKILKVVPVQGDVRVVDVVGCDVVLVVDNVARLDDAALQATLTQSAD